MASRLSKPARARRYLQASMSAGYTGLPAAHREAYEAQMRAHERAYAGVARHALVGTDRDFDKSLSAGEREHQRHLRDEQGITNAELAAERKQLRDRDGTRPASTATPANPTFTGPRVARAAAGAGAGAVATVTGSGGNTFLWAIGLMLGLSLVYLLVAGKGAGALTGITNVVVGGVRAFVAPVDPIKHLETALGAAPVTAGTSSTSSPSSPSSSSAPVGSGAAAFAPGGQLRRKDQGRDVQYQPGEGLQAPGAGEVIAVLNDPTGFGPDYPVVKFSSGPYAHKPPVYFGHTDSTLAKGTKFNAHTIIARTSKTGHNAPPGWAEIGFAPGGAPGPMGQAAPF